MCHPSRNSVVYETEGGTENKMKCFPIFIVINDTWWLVRLLETYRVGPQKTQQMKFSLLIETIKCH